MKDLKDKCVHTDKYPFVLSEGLHDLRTGLVEQVSNGNELVPLGTQAVDDLGQGCNGVGALAATIVHKDNVAFVKLGVVQNAFDDGGGGRRRSSIGFAPIMGVHARPDDDVTHGLWDRQHLNFAGSFGLMIDSVRRPKQERLNAEITFQQ